MDSKPLLVKTVKLHLVTKVPIVMKQYLFAKVTLCLDNDITGTYHVD